MGNALLAPIASPKSLHGSHNYARLYYHFIPHAKYKLPTLACPARKLIMDTAEEKAEKYGGKVLSMNGSETHLHFLVNAYPTFDLPGFIGQTKGASSFKINKELQPSAKFSFQIGYAVFSISYGHVDKVKGYIFKQQRHHSCESPLEARFNHDELRPWGHKDPVQQYLAGENLFLDA